MGGGFTTDWGVHMIDVAQWAMGLDNSGPVEIIPKGYKNTKALTWVYNTDVKMTQETFNDKGTKGVKFIGSDGWFEVARGYFKGSSKKLEPNLKKETGPYETKIPHQVNFIEAARAKKDPVVTVEIGHRTYTACTLANIAHELGRPVKWDPKMEEFVQDPQADLYMHREYRKGYKLPII